MNIPELLDVSLFLRDRNILKLFRAVSAAGGVLRFVGGAVRDALAGLKSFELDLATDLSPDELTDACNEADLKTVPIGLKSTATGVVINKKIYTVASLHKRSSADGYSTEFTDDWKSDASMRDLTINAIYADEHGNVYDYYNGLSDLKNGIVRFIGDAEERIRENPVRIMRFFRFYSLFGKGTPDQDSLNACVKCKDLLRTLAVEPVRDELFKILLTPRAADTLKIMIETEILGYMLPVSENLDLLSRFNRIVSQNNQIPDPLRRVYILYLPDVKLAENLAVRLHLPKDQKRRLVNWAKYRLDPHELDNNANYLNRKVYEYGKSFCKDKLLFLTAAGKISEKDGADLMCNVDMFRIPKFPVKGSDLIANGYSDGKKIGEALDDLKKVWIDSNFSLQCDELLQKLSAE